MDPDSFLIPHVHMSRQPTERGIAKTGYMKLPYSFFENFRSKQLYKKKKKKTYQETRGFLRPHF
jgi:hypothetical protein